MVVKGYVCGEGGGDRRCAGVCEGLCAWERGMGAHVCACMCVCVCWGPSLWGCERDSGWGGGGGVREWGKGRCFFVLCVVVFGGDGVYVCGGVGVKVCMGVKLFLCVCVCVCVCAPVHTFCASACMQICTW